MARISAAEKAKVRERLLVSAARHFAAHGLHGANVNHISEGAGYSKGTVYNYFASKEALFAAVLAAGSSVAADRYRARAPVAGVRARLTALVEEDVAVARAHPDFLRVLLRERHTAEEGTQALIAEALGPLHALVVSIVEAGQAAGELRTDEASVRLAGVFSALVLALYGERLREPEAWPAWDELPAVAVAFFLDGAAAAPRAWSSTAASPRDT